MYVTQETFVKTFSILHIVLVIDFYANKCQRNIQNLNM